ncbi:MAG TPA: hypothetical protein VNC16_04355 [Solirubrobacterales bacterium]|nr:hypothetical protein [Solirubrobacterales bacterium]
MRGMLLLVIAAVIVLTSSAQATVMGEITSYPSRVTFAATPNGGGVDGTGETMVVTITSPKAACRQRRLFHVAIESAPGHEKTYVYRTDAAGRWTLDTVASIGPARVTVAVPSKRLDRSHRCKTARTAASVP